MVWTSAQIMSALYIVVAVMLIIILYHVLFIVVDVRKMVKRADRVTESVEGVAMKPLAVADQAMDWVIHQLLNNKHPHGKHVEGHEKHKKS